VQEGIDMSHIFSDALMFKGLLTLSKKEVGLLEGKKTKGDPQCTWLPLLQGLGEVITRQPLPSK